VTLHVSSCLRAFVFHPEFLCVLCLSAVKNAFLPRETMTLATDNLRHTKLPLNNGSGAIPALGFGTLIPDPVATRVATKAALEAGFRLLDTAERYRTEREVGEAMQGVFKEGKVKREDVFVITKLWKYQ